MEVTRGMDQVGSSDAPRRRTALGTGTSEQWLSVLYFLYFLSVISQARCPLSLLSHVLVFL